MRGRATESRWFPPSSGRSGPTPQVGFPPLPRGEKGSGGRARAIVAVALITAMLGIVSPSSAQSPFTGPPSRTGSFGIPRAGAPSDRTPAPRPPGAPSAAEAPSLRPLPGSSAPSALPEPLPPGDLPEALGVETSPSRLGGPTRTGVLPPRPYVAPPLSAEPTGPVPRSEPIVLRSGMAATLRITQVIPSDGFSSGERLLNSRPPLQPGDCFLAELIDPCPPTPILVGGTVTRIIPPGHFGKPGYVSLQLTQLVERAEGEEGWLPWRMDMADRRFTTKMRRVLLTAMLGVEGVATGASIGAQFRTGNMAFIGAGMGIGALVGFGYATLQRGVEANLEPGDMFQVVVGTTEYRPISREWQTILYPAADAEGGKLKKLK